jgi:3-oxoacyl-(acyl-carrier-protein) synthase
MKRKVVVTGMGVISSLGNNLNENHQSLRHALSGIGKADFFESAFVATLPFAEINASDEQLRMMVPNAPNPSYTRTTLIAIHAVLEAIQDAQLTKEQVQSNRTAFISSSTVGGMCYTDSLYNDANDNGNPSPYVRSYEGSDHTVRMALYLGLTGYTDTINTACSSSANAIMQGMRLIQTGRADRVIVGGADCLAKYTVNGFNALRILSDSPCKPFDQNRDGLTLGEAAAYLVLEAEECSVGKRKWAEVSGAGNANDAHHPSATSDDARGPVLAMTRALENAGLRPDQIAYINAHGTGTENNDRTECVGFQRVFGTPPVFNSTKSYTGHTLGAAGSLEAVFTILSIANQEVYASLNCEHPQTEFAFQPVRSHIQVLPIAHAMSNSFGFGGNCTSLIFSACS